MKTVEMVGKRFGMLTVVERDHGVDMTGAYWSCKCDCGSIKTVRGTALRQGLISACGCIRRGVGRKTMTKHGNYGHPLYNTWHHMMNRCYKAKGGDLEMYQNRGIKVCDRWHDFKSFANDMGERPPNKSLDRRDNDGNYEPSNCRWATAKEQANNTRKTLMFDWDGKRRSLSSLCDQYKKKKATVWARMKRGMTLKDALLLPIVTPTSV